MRLHKVYFLFFHVAVDAPGNKRVPAGERKYPIKTRAESFDL